MNRFSVSISFVLCIFLVACSTPKPPRPVIKEMMLPTVIAGSTVPQNEMDSVRFGENVKAYTVGRYIDPNNPDVMHERNIIYRVEDNCSWNTMPNEPFSLPFKKYQDNRQKLIAIQQPLTAELEAEIGRQKQLREQLKQNDETIRKTLGVSQKTNINVEKVLNSSLQVSQKLRQLEDQVFQMKEREKKNLMIINNLIKAQNELNKRLQQEIMKNQQLEKAPSEAKDELDFGL